MVGDNHASLLPRNSVPYQAVSLYRCMPAPKSIFLQHLNPFIHLFVLIYPPSFSEIDCVPWSPHNLMVTALISPLPLKGTTKSLWHTARTCIEQGLSRHRMTKKGYALVYAQVYCKMDSLCHFF